MPRRRAIAPITAKPANSQVPASCPITGKLIQGGVRQQTQQIFANIVVLLKVYGEHFGKPYPARTTVAVSELALGALVEMEMVARKA
jgi:enamine deaminase RidA (YjgF/YER057c/UK114 family)